MSDEKIVVRFVPGVQFGADNSMTAVSQRCAAVAERYRIDSRVAERLGRPAEAAGLMKLHKAYLAAVEGA